MGVEPGCRCECTDLGSLIMAESHFAGGQGTRPSDKIPLVQEGRPVLGTSKRSSIECVEKSRTEASRMVRGGRKSTVRDAPYEGTSIAAVYGTD